MVYHIAIWYTKWPLRSHFGSSDQGILVWHGRSRHPMGSAIYQVCCHRRKAPSPEETERLSHKMIQMLQESRRITQKQGGRIPVSTQQGTGFEQARAKLRSRFGRGFHEIHELKKQAASREWMAKFTPDVPSRWQRLVERRLRAWQHEQQSLTLKYIKQLRLGC